jgi:hypothetical protein
MKKIIFIFLLLLCANIITAQNTFRKKPYLLFQNKLNTTGTLFTPEIRDIVILWQLYSLEICTIEWGIEDDPVIYELGSVLVDPISGSDIQYKFSFFIDDLIPQTKYYYKVIAPIDNTEEVEVVESSFVSPPPENSSELTFFAYSDTQNPNSGSPSQNHDIVCQQINAVINSNLSNQTFILHAGDYNDENTEDSWQLNYFNNTQVNVRDMISQLPVMGAYGNHDMWKVNPSPPGPMVFEKYWPYSYIEPADPENAYNRYYSFDYGPVHVIVLNLPWPNWNLQNYIIEDWLQDDLENSADKWKVFVFHTPGYSNTNSGIHYPNCLVLK